MIAVNMRITEIIKLERLLFERNIRYEIRRVSDGYEISVGDIKAKQYTGTAGWYRNTIEVNGEGNLTAQDAIIKILKMM